MPKQKTRPEYEKAKRLSKELKNLYSEISVIDIALAEMQEEKARDELDGNKVNPFWKRMFEVKKKNTSYFAEPCEYRNTRSITLSEMEFVQIRAFKQEQINRINREVSELSAQINGE